MASEEEKAARKAARKAKKAEEAERQREDALMSEVPRGAVAENAASVAHRPLPAIPPEVLRQRDRWGNPPTTLCLFYQYIEPAWSESEHREALRFVINLATRLKVTGRGRCAAEGLNCTLTGSAEAVREFCEGLRAWNKTFLETDFKLTDGIEFGKRFKALTIRKTTELVAYGLAGDKAPPLASSSAKHVEATEYHKLMEDPDAVIVDVRNAYESAIGHFKPPSGGAELIDPCMRNSHEFPKWLNAPETQAKLNGKKVLMYCTGGIRCERATALLDQIETSNPDFQTQGVTMVRGGIERYLKTFPEGGHWMGKNYLFDRRFEQVPEAKDPHALEREMESECVLCSAKWDLYRGKHKCATELCKVPVLVCDGCQKEAVRRPKDLQCPLCQQGISLRELALPEVLKENERKRKAEAKAAREPSEAEVRKQARLDKNKSRDPSERLFVGGLPLSVSATDVYAALGVQGAEAIEWIPDRKTGFFYGSVFLKMRSLAEAEQLVQKAYTAQGVRFNGKKLKVNFAPIPTDGEKWPPKGHVNHERPPIPLTA
mmetsp:Transcript_23750/g.77230  ORF Transcript_23750/g.77230 Transcript_23750/m.77230 type:complete len:545 (+) Transcript_23750:3-1637(+)